MSSYLLDLEFFGLKLGLGHWIAAPAALAGTTLMACLFGLVALRATGLGFLMLTLAMSQVLWGTAYRWVALTDGDNGLRGLTRPFGLDGATPFYYFVFAVSAASIPRPSRASSTCTSTATRSPTHSGWRRASTR